MKTSAQFTILFYIRIQYTIMLHAVTGSMEFCTLGGGGGGGKWGKGVVGEKG